MDESALGRSSENWQDYAEAADVVANILGMDRDKNRPGILRERIGNKEITREINVR